MYAPCYRDVFDGFRPNLLSVVAGIRCFAQVGKLEEATTIHLSRALTKVNATLGFRSICASL